MTPIFRYFFLSSILAVAGMLLSCAHNSSTQAQASTIKLATQDKDKLAKTIWKNECGGTVKGLTSWNAGEEFPSLGIGHFIWYPQGYRGIYEESFPGFIQFAAKAGYPAPSWTTGACPWTNRNQFLADKQGTKLTALRQWLASTINLQLDYIVKRSLAALPKMAAQSYNPKDLYQKYYALAATPQGVYALIDYVNFKGEGTNPKERYKGQGWGLAQVLEAMPSHTSGLATAQAFSQSAKNVLSQRVANSPQERGEQRWLKGWHARCDTYKHTL